MDGRGRRLDLDLDDLFADESNESGHDKRASAAAARSDSAMPPQAVRCRFGISFHRPVQGRKAGMVPRVDFGATRQEQLCHSHRIPRGGIVQRGPITVGSDVGLDSARQEQLRHGDRIGFGRRVQRGRTVGISRTDVGSTCQEQLRNLR